MLSKHDKASRLAKKRDFEFVFEHPDRLNGRFLYLLYRKNTISHARLGIMLKKKYLKSAVHRNLVKRVIRESFRQHKPTLPLVDIIVFSRIAMTAPDKKALRREIDAFWLKLASKGK